MSVSKLSTDELFWENYFTLDEEVILKINDNNEVPGLNNVIVGMNNHCYGLMVLDNEVEFTYQIFYVTFNKQLEGHLLQLSINIPDRDGLVLYFAKYLAQLYVNLDVIDVFNTFQTQSRSFFEHCDFQTISRLDFHDPKKMLSNSMIIAKGKRGIIPMKIIEKTEFYKGFFGNCEFKFSDERVNYVYLMLNKRNNFIKIGRSINPLFREKTLQADEPEIELISFWKVPKRVEKSIQKVFLEKKQRGEWYDLNFNDLRIIKEKMNQFAENGNS
jgi:hypothetical protein